MSGERSFGFTVKTRLWGSTSLLSLLVLKVWSKGLQNALCMLTCALFRGNGRFTAFSPQPSQPQDLGSGQVSLLSLFTASRPRSNSSYLQT